MKKTFLRYLIILISIISCKHSPKQNIELEQSSVKASYSGKYNLDVTQSKVNWAGYVVKKSLNLISHFGTVKFKEGEISFADNKLKKGNFIIDLSTITNEDVEDLRLNAKLLTRLKGDVFLDVKMYPTAIFTIKTVKNIEGVSDYNSEISGTIELKKHIKPIVVKANIRAEGDFLFLNTEKFSLNRQDFGIGIRYKGDSDILVTDNFDLQFSIVAHLK